MKTPEYLKTARATLFMASRTMKYCGEIEENRPAALAYTNDLKRKLAADGITDVKSQLGEMRFSEIVEMVSKIMAENGGPFNFSEERYYAYGRQEIRKGSPVGRLLKLSGS